ncbi:MAG TPA: hypothetical protein VF138_10610 [Caulobacteraceae bacterium]
MDCRHVSTIEVRTSPEQTYKVVVDEDVPFVVDGRLLLFPGEMVTISLPEAEGTAVPVVKEKWASGRLPVVSADDLLSQMTPEALEMAMPMTMDPEIPKVREAPKNAIRFSFLQYEGRTDTVLVVENGYTGRLDYHAMMVVPGGGLEPTTVCEVSSARPTYEHWPHPMVQIVLSDMRLVADQGDGPCD